MFRKKEDVLPVSIILFLTIIDFSLFFLISNKLVILSYFIVMIIPKGIICSWNHHHQHTNVFKNKTANKTLEFFYGLHTGAVRNLWVLHHNIGHHKNYLDQEKDESRWKDKNGKQMGYFRYSFEVMLTSYYRALLVGKKHKKIRNGMIKMAALTIVFLISLSFINFFNTVFLFIVPMIISLFLTSQATYKHHVGLDTKDKYKASHTDLNKFWNVLTGNLGYHTAHHVKPNKHWSELPSFHEEIKHLIPKENIHNKIL